jgi:hypothetical protein
MSTMFLGINKHCFRFKVSKGYIQDIAPPEEHCHNSKNTTFQERGKTTGRDNATASKERYFLPLMTTLENRCVTPFH